MTGRALDGDHDVFIGPQVIVQATLDRPPVAARVERGRFDRGQQRLVDTRHVGRRVVEDRIVATGTDGDDRDPGAMHTRETLRIETIAGLRDRDGHIDRLLVERAGSLETDTTPVLIVADRHIVTRGAEECFECGALRTGMAEYQGVHTPSVHPVGGAEQGPSSVPNAGGPTKWVISLRSARSTVAGVPVQ